MDNKALEIVRDYINDHLDVTDRTANASFEVYTVWKCKALQNWKYLLSSTLPDGMYYELTYNGDKGEWYLDVYKKFENKWYGRYYYQKYFSFKWGCNCRKERTFGNL